MYPPGQMSGSYYDPRAGFTPPCYNNYCNPTVPVTPYQHFYPSPHPYVAPHPVMQPYCHPHHPYYHPMPGTPVPVANCYVANEACTPIQQQRQPVWRPVVVPPSSCCCGHSNLASLYGYPWSDAKVSNVNENEDVKNVEDASARPVLSSGGSNSSRPQLYWIPPEYVNNLQQQGADKVEQDGKIGGQMIPLDLDKLASLLNMDSNKPVTAGVRKDLPFIFMPSNSDKSRESTMKRISEIEEKPSIYNNAGTLKLLDNGDVASTVPPEPVKTSEARSESVSQVIQTQNDKVRVKDIPVKQAEDSSEQKSTTNAAGVSRSRSVSPTKKSKLPPVCLRVDPLPRKKNGNGTPKPPSSPSHGGDTQQTAQTGKAAHNITDDTKNLEVVEASSKESPNDNPVLDESGNVKNRRENINDGKLTDSKKYLQPEITPAGHEEGNEVKVRANISEETAAVRIQSAYRGYEERKWHSVHKLRQIAKVREQISSIKDRIQALENNADMNKDEFEKQRLVLGETIMSHLLTLDTIQGLHPSIRDVRKSVARELISLQEKLDLFHAQRFGLKGHATNHGNKDVPCSKTEEQDSSDTGTNAGEVQEDKCQENESKNITAIDGSVDKTEILTESTYAGLHKEETCAENAHMDTQVVTQLMGDSPRPGEAISNFSTGNEADLKLISSPDEGKENTEGIILEEQPLDGVNDSSVAELYNVELAVYPQVVKKTNPISCDTTAEIGEVVSGEVAADGNEQVSKSGDEPAVEECDKTNEHICNHVEKQPEQQTVKCESEISYEQETIAVSTYPSQDVIHTMKDVEKLAPSPVSSDDKTEQASEILLSSDAASDESVVTYNGFSIATPDEVAEIDEDNCMLPDDEGKSIPRLSDVSRTSTVDADSLVVSEENDKLRETVRKLLESEKEQLAVITTLNERLRNVEKKLKKKRNRKLKVYKSLIKNHEFYDQNTHTCTM